MTDTAEIDKVTAFKKAASALEPGVLLPDRVLTNAWQHFFFFEADRLFAPEFAEIQRELLMLEGGTVTCLIDLDQTAVLEFESAATLYLDLDTSSETYSVALRCAVKG